MNQTIFTVYWTYKNLVPNSLQFTDMNKALAHMEKLRKDAKESKYSAITMCSENVDQVGKAGVDEVVNGKTPDGEVYDWDKSSRIGKVKKSERALYIGTDSIEVKLDDE